MASLLQTAGKILILIGYKNLRKQGLREGAREGLFRHLK